VFRRNPTIHTFAIALTVVVAVTATQADDVSKKWRIGLAVGGFNADDEIESASANEMFTINECARTLSCSPGAELVIRAFRDPRNDSQVFGSLDVNPATVGTLSVQYGVSKIFVVEGSVGYQIGDVGDVEVAAQLPGAGSEEPAIIPFNFQTQRVTVGELERVPIRITALARFRPRATFNPYVGAGIGYSIIGFDVTGGLDEISQNMDASRGRQLRLTPFFATTGSSDEGLQRDNVPQLDLQGATIDARDTFEWHIGGGAELTIKKRWSLFLDLRWVDASRSFSIGFNNSDELGNSVPNFAPFDDSPVANERYGPSEVGNCGKDASGNLDHNGNPVLCTGGGLIDFGHLIVIPADEAPPSTDCTDPNDISSAQCVLEFVFEPDGVPDPGLYYAVGGSVDYDGLSAQFGARFTFGK
jgi:opacity protein-like surface antigen